MKNLEIHEIKQYAEQKTLNYLRRYFSTHEDYNAPDGEFIDLHQSEYNSCMHMFISGYQFAAGVKNLDVNFEYKYD